MKQARAFSLIELLVTIAIIAVLLALMAAAIDRAIYAAELATCGTRLYAMSSGLVSYATGFNRAYPYRLGVEQGDWESHKLYQSFRPDGPYDERPALKGFVSLKTMLDPLCPEVVVDEGVTQPDDVVFRNSQQWAGFRWNVGQGMKRIGSRMTFTDDVHYPTPQTFRFSLLASDRDIMNAGNQNVDSSHPDAEGVLVDMRWQSEDVGGGFGLIAETLLRATYSGWYNLGAVYRGPSDFNYAYEDGSVLRLDDVLYTDDERMVRVANYPNPAGVPTVGAWPSQFVHLPRP